MGLDLIDLVSRLKWLFGVRIIPAGTGSSLYDSAFDPPAVLQTKRGTRALQHPLSDWDDGPSRGGMSILSGSPLTSWSSIPLTAHSETEYALQLMPDSPVVVGRSDGWSPEYLDPAYLPTRIVPGTGQSVLHSGGSGTDRCVSRAHFMLQGVPGGILFVNGVPRRGGGIRPPHNWTRLIAPEGRDLSPGEEYLIGSGNAVVVLLPNGTEIRIDAE
jgi:hypothetical protein